MLISLKVCLVKPLQTNWQTENLGPGDVLKSRRTACFLHKQDADMRRLFCAIWKFACAQCTGTAETSRPQDRVQKCCCFLPPDFHNTEHVRVRKKKKKNVLNWPNDQQVCSFDTFTFKVTTVRNYHKVVLLNIHRGMLKSSWMTMKQTYPKIKLLQ